MSLQREPRKPAVSGTLIYTLGPVLACSQMSFIGSDMLPPCSCLDMTDGPVFRCTF